MAHATTAAHLIGSASAGAARRSDARAEASRERARHVSQIVRDTLPGWVPAAARGRLGVRALRLLRAGE